MSRICMIGSWHQAMVYGAGLADLGHTVIGVCETPELAEQLNAARPVVHEPGLPQLMRRTIRNRRLRYTSDLRAGLKGAQFAFISIDTPVLEDDSPDLDGVVAVARAIRSARSSDLVLCVSAQVPVGTSERLLEAAHNPADRYRSSVAYVPEFLRLGSAIETFKKADRIVVGADDPAVARKVAALYSPLKRPTYLTGLRSAEMAKHASNTFLATSISFINEIANICEEVGADAATVAAILRADRRIGPNAFVTPGLGFAGGTLGRDIRALQQVGAAHGIGTPLLDAVISVNGSRAERIIDRMEQAFGTLAGRRIAFLGLTYKPRTSTLRRALSLEIIRDLTQGGASVSAFDPLADLQSAGDLPPLERAESPYTAAEGADAVVFMTEWDDIDNLELRQLRKRMVGPLFIDTKNFFDPAAVAAAGFQYAGVGRPAVSAKPGSDTRRRARKAS